MHFLTLTLTSLVTPWSLERARIGHCMVKMGCFRIYGIYVDFVPVRTSEAFSFTSAVSKLNHGLGHE